MIRLMVVVTVACQSACFSSAELTQNFCSEETPSVVPPVPRVPYAEYSEDVDLSECEPRRMAKWLSQGSAWVTVQRSGARCQVWLGGETENPRYNGETTQFCSFCRKPARVAVSLSAWGGPARIESSSCIRNTAPTVPRETPLEASLRELPRTPQALNRTLTGTAYDEMTPLMQAVMVGDVARAAEYLAAGADPNIEVRPTRRGFIPFIEGVDSTALCVAVVMEGNGPAMVELLTQHGARESKSGCMRVARFLAASLRGDVEAMKSLDDASLPALAVENGLAYASSNTRGRSSDEVFVWAAQRAKGKLDPRLAHDMLCRMPMKQRLAALRVLVQRKIKLTEFEWPCPTFEGLPATLDLPDADLFAVLGASGARLASLDIYMDYESRSRDGGALVRMLEATKDELANGPAVLALAIRDGRAAVVDAAIFKKRTLDVPLQCTPLRMAAELNDVALVKRLLAVGADALLAGRDGVSALAAVDARGSPALRRIFKLAPRTPDAPAEPPSYQCGLDATIPKPVPRIVFGGEEGKFQESHDCRDRKPAPGEYCR